ncbi:MAG: hypothetical protein HN548_05100 [Opitutae bacterium]|jgi:S1-C subfamily serine protease|nr:hypothetical protein [Opitutae bacterium]MBT5716623.1 hypothetical protein [Opitutae bacterium]
MKYLLRSLISLPVIISIFTLQSLHAEKDLYSKVAPSCLEILVNGRLDGSGVICNKKGLVITAFHVVKKRQKIIEALSKTLGRLPLRLIATNRGSDLALFSLPEKKNAYPALSLANDIPIEGTDVFLMGSPIFRHHLLLKGCIARRTETYSWYDGSFKNTFPIAGIAAPGSSGGPWVNSKGEIIAIQVAGVTTDFGHQGVNSAVGGISLKSFLENKETVIVPTIQSAVEELWGQSTRLISDMPKEVKGLLFRQVSPHGVCAKAGIKDEDIMLKADNLVYERIEPFVKYIRSRKIGEEIKFLISNSNGENEKMVSVKLAELK